MKRKSILALALALITIGSAVQAEVDLGSNTAMERTFSSNYQEAVAAAFPHYQGQALQKRLSDIVKKYPQGIDRLRVWNQDQLKSIMSAVVPTAMGDTATPDRQYLTNRTQGRVFYYQKPSLAPIKMAQIATIRPQIETLHANLLQRIGITKEDLLFQRTDLMVGQASSAPSGGHARKMDQEVLGVQTYAIRAIDGILVEDGEVRIVSSAPNRIDLLDAHWTPLTFAPNASSLQLRPDQDVQKAITNRIKSLADGRKVSVKMAVVMRRVQGRDYYVPAMKVGIRMDGEGEGVVFYEALSNQPLSEASDKTDTAAGGS